MLNLIVVLMSYKFNWKIFNKKGKDDNNINFINLELKKVKQNWKKKISDYKKQLSGVNEIHEDKDNYTKSNKNNHNFEISKDESE